MPSSRSNLWIMGVDACPRGWVAVRLHVRSGRLDAAVGTAEQLLAGNDAAVIAVDIPIGLPSAGERECDEIARDLLGWPRSASVFPAPIRPALGARSQSEASRLTRAVDGRGVSVQASAIYGKIREVDALLRTSPALQRRVYEIHPELSFWGWNGCRPMQYRKKSRLGKAERLALIRQSYGADGIAAIAELRRQHRRRDLGDDDIHDAFAALWSAERIVRGHFDSVPEEPPIDAVGLPMRIMV